MKPPRALAVPFELGRPMGAPNEPAFQRRVLGALLDLFKLDKGPVLVDFPDQAPASSESQEGWSCPVNLAPAPPTGSARDRVQTALQDEIERLRPWHEETRRARGRTTVGISGIPLNEIPALMMAYAQNLAMVSPQAGTPMPIVMKRATDDLKAFYYEAATAKPGRISDVALGDWLWGETAFGRALLMLREACLASEDSAIRNLGQLQLMPNHQRDKRT